MLWLELLEFLGSFGLRSAPPHTGSPGPFGPGTPEESGKSPESARGRAAKVPKECAPESQKSPKRVSNLTFRLSLRTLLRLRGALFRHFCGPALGHSLGTLFGLFRASGPEGPGRPCVGRGRSQVLREI